MNLSSYYRENFSSFLWFICYHKPYIYKPFRRSISSYLLIITSFSCMSYFLLPRFPRKRMLKDHILSMKNFYFSEGALKEIMRFRTRNLDL